MVMVALRDGAIRIGLQATAVEFAGESFFVGRCTSNLQLNRRPLTAAPRSARPACPPAKRSDGVDLARTWARQAPVHALRTAGSRTVGDGVRLMAVAAPMTCFVALRCTC